MEAHVCTRGVLYISDGDSRKVGKSVYLRERGSRGQIMVGRSNLVAYCQASEANLSNSDLPESGGKLFANRHRLEEKISARNFFSPKRRIFVAMTALSGISILGIVVGLLVDKCSTSTNDNYIGNYFEKPEENRFQLNILPEYEVERYVFPAIMPTSADEVVDNDEGRGGATILYRIPGGPKSPRAEGKRPSLIQHGIICDKDPCTVNKPQFAIVYLLVDQGYDVWLGISNSSMAENAISSERIERKRLEYVAECVLTSTNQTELLVMGYFNGSVQFFGISAPPVVKEQSKLSQWLEYIPGVKTAKRWYYKGKSYLTRSYDKVIESFDRLGKNVDFIIDDPSITNLKNTVMRAWGIVVTMVVPTLTIKDFSNMINHPDVYLDTGLDWHDDDYADKKIRLNHLRFGQGRSTKHFVGTAKKLPQLITKYGYESEVHQVKTADGYLLAVHRITGSKNHPPKAGKPVVYLQHGILASSAVWILMGPSKGLGYLLADEGYDVWMGNSRGNTYSRAHVNMTTSDTKFWDFSFHEMGVYDLPATIDHIIDQTGQEKINYIGHSQGTTSFFVMLSEKPEYNDKIVKFVAYAPIIYTNNVRSPIIYLFSKISTPIYRALQFLKTNDFLPTNALLTKIGREVCEARTLYQVVCSNALFMVTGYDSEQMNKTAIPIILGHLPAGSSVKQFLHFGQELNSKKFRQFDYVQPEKNRAKYGQSEPPNYNIANVKVPVAFFYATNDWLADAQDIEKLSGELSQLEMIYKVPMQLFNHIDFMFAIDAPALIYRPTIDYLRKPLKKT